MKRKAKRKPLVIIRRFLTRIGENGLSSLAAQGAYYLMVSLVPMMILILTVLKYTPLDLTFATEVIIRFVPEYFQDFVAKIVHQIYNNSALVLSFSALALFWSASKGLYVLVDGFNVIHNSTELRTYWQNLLLSFAYTAVLVVAIPLLLTVTIFGNALLRLIMRWIPIINRFELLIQIARFFGSTLLIFLVLLLMYRFIPKGKNRLRHVAIGALAATLTWQAFSYLFGMYVSLSVDRSGVYGGLSIILMLMLWFYCAMYIVFAGCQIVQMLHTAGAPEDAVTLRLTAVAKMRRHRGLPAERAETGISTEDDDTLTVAPKRRWWRRH
ncbi:MAG: YihY/virulence factor BrkB family protein [Eubacteriales bacterium]|nr:YihY/virulence factor BrkB family protein [Eubacteriales bacterium]